MVLRLSTKDLGAPQEFVAARKAIDTLGGETVRLAPSPSPVSDRETICSPNQKGPAYAEPLSSRTRTRPKEAIAIELLATNMSMTWTGREYQ